MSRQKLCNILLVVLGIILILVGIILVNLPSKKENTNHPEEENVNENNNISEKTESKYYTCNKKQLQKEKYTIDYVYEFDFVDGELSYGVNKFVYTFNNVDDYNSFEIKQDDKFDPNKIENDDQSLTKTYIFNYAYPQKGAKTAEEYIDTLEDMDYICVER